MDESKQKYKTHNVVGVFFNSPTVSLEKGAETLETMLNDGLQFVRLASGEDYVLFDMQMPPEVVLEPPRLDTESDRLSQMEDAVEVALGKEPGEIAKTYPGYVIWKMLSGKVQLVKPRNVDEPIETEEVKQ